MTKQMIHALNCPGSHWDSECTCGLAWRELLETERSIRAAWEKRAMEAEVELRNALKHHDKYHEQMNEVLKENARLQKELRRATSALVRNGVEDVAVEPAHEPTVVHAPLCASVQRSAPAGTVVKPPTGPCNCGALNREAPHK